MTVYRVRSTQTGTDDYGDPIFTEDRMSIPGAYTFPRTSADVTGVGRDGIVVGLTMHAPHGSDVTRTDVIEDKGERWRIVGEVADWTNPLTGWKPGVAVALERAEG